MQTITVTSLHCYPIKSCKGIALQTAIVSTMGIMYDRQWMVVNEDGVFVAQRGDVARGAVGAKTMCLIEVAITAEHLVVNAPGMQPLQLPLAGIDGDERSVRVWDSVCRGIDQGDEAAAWFTEYLGREVEGNYRVVRMPDAGDRLTETNDTKLAYADGFPFLIISEASLAHLNTMTDDPIPMNRFRPNIVIAGCEPHAEDEMKSFSIGNVAFTGVRPCGRCPIPTIDQDTAVQGKFPLNALATYRKTPRGVMFGMNLNHHNTGAISVGEQLVLQG